MGEKSTKLIIVILCDGHFRQLYKEEHSEELSHSRYIKLMASMSC